MLLVMRWSLILAMLWSRRVWASALGDVGHLASVDKLAIRMTQLYEEQYSPRCITFVMEQGRPSWKQLSSFELPRMLVDPRFPLEVRESQPFAWYKCNHYILEAETSAKLEHYVNLSRRVLKQSSGYFTLILTHESKQEQVTELLYSPFFSKVLKVLLWVPSLTSSQDLLAFRHDVTTTDQVTEVNVWTGSRLGQPSSVSMFTELVRDLKGRQLRATAFGFVPFTARALSPYGDHVYDGIEFQSFDEVARAMNFSYRVHLPKTASKWAGVISDLREELTDFGVCHLFLTYPRASILDYTPSINNDYYCFLVGPPDDMPRWMSMVQPLTWGTWLALGITLTCAFIFGYIYAFAYEQAEIGPAHFVFVLIGSFIDNSHSETFWLKSNAIRLFMLNFLLASFVITMAYKDSLISFMTVPTVLSPIDTIAEVVESPLQVRSLGNVVKDNLHTSEDPMMLQLDAKYSTHNNLEEGFVNVTQKRLILLEALQMAKYRLRRDFTDDKGRPQMHIVSECMQHFDVVFFLQKNSIYTESMARIVTQLKEAGIFEKHLEDGLSLGISVGKNGDEGKNDKPLTLFELQGAFVIVGLFCSAALGALLLEIAL